MKACILFTSDNEVSEDWLGKFDSREPLDIYGQKYLIDEISTDYEPGFAGVTIKMYPAYQAKSPERPKKQESWNGESLPPVGLDVLAKVDFKKAPPYTIINLTEIGIDVQNSIPSFQKARVLYASEKYVILLARGVECMAPRSCVEFEKIKTAEKLAEEEKVAAIAEMQSVVMAASGCMVSTISECLAIVALYEAGYRKQ